jgi:hypothetical protein
MKRYIGPITAIIVYALLIPSSALATFLTSEPEGSLKGSTVTFKLGGGIDVCSNPKGHRFNLTGNEAQTLTSKGTHESEGIETWGECEFSSLGLKGKATVSGCSFHLISNPGETKGLTGAVQKECIFKAESCEIKVPSVGNQTLKNAADVANSKANDVVTVHATGITETVSPTCELAGIKAEKEATETGEITNIGQNVA